MNEIKESLQHVIAAIEDKQLRAKLH